MKFLIILFGLIAIVPQCYADFISIDTETSTNGAGVSGSTETWNITIGNNKNRCLVVSCYTSQGGALPVLPITGVTLGRNAFTLAVSTGEATDGIGVSLWTLGNPPSGPQTITATIGGGGNATNFLCDSASFYGCSGFQLVDASSGTSILSTNVISSTITTPSQNDWLVDAVEETFSGSTMNPGPLQNLILRVNNATQGNTTGFSYRPNVSPGSTFMTWSVTAGRNDTIAIIGIRASQGLSIISSAQQYFSSSGKVGIFDDLPRGLWIEGGKTTIWGAKTLVQ